MLGKLTEKFSDIAWTLGARVGVDVCKEDGCKDP
jgi:hypothetical protein